MAQRSAGVLRVSATDLRRLFNGEHILSRTRARQLVRRVLDYDNHLTRRQVTKMNRDPRTRVRFTRCTRSQMVLFSTPSGAAVAIAHQYAKQDGSLAGSGKADPKWLRVRGQSYKLR